MADEIFEPRNVRLLSNLYSTQTSQRVESEATLPDYKEAAGRILRITPHARVTEKSITLQGQSVVCELEGAVSFHVLYLPEGAEAGAEGASFLIQESFSRTLTCSASTEGLDPEEIFALVELKTENVFAKLVGPRRMNVRCEVKIHLNLKGNRDFSCYEELDREDMHCKKTSWEATRLLGTHRESISFTESITLPTAYPAISEIAQMEVDLICRKVKSQEGGIRFSGYCDIRCSYFTGEEMVSFYQPIEFDKNLGLALCGENTLCRVLLTPGYLHANPDVNEDGEMKKIDFEIGADLEVLVFETLPLSSVLDAYSTEYEMDLTTARSDTEHLFASYDFAVQQKASVPLNSHDLVRAEDPCCRAEFVNSYWDGNNIVLEGFLEISYLGETEKGEKRSESLRYEFCVTVPFEGTHSHQNEERIEVSALCRGVDLAPVADQMQLRFELCGTLDLYERQTVEYLKEILQGEKLCDREKALIFYYPDPDEDLWQIAKKFRVSPHRLLGEGDWEEDLPRAVRIL